MSETCFTAVRYDDGEKLLDVANEFFKKYDLSLVEERIGNRRGKYARSPKHYKDLEEYYEIQEKQRRGKELSWTTNFLFFGNPSDNSGWKIFLYNEPVSPLHGVKTNENFSKHVSSKLNAKCIDYSYYSVVDQLRLRCFRDGKLTDELCFMFDNGVDFASGFFKKFEGTKGTIKDSWTNERFEGKEAEAIEAKHKEIWQAQYDFLDKEGFNIEKIQWGYDSETNRRPMYLKGGPSAIQKFFASQAF